MTAAAHERLVEAARDAIDAVHNDTSVPRQRTLESLRSLYEHIDPMVEALAADIECDATEPLGAEADAAT